MRKIISLFLYIVCSATVLNAQTASSTNTPPPACQLAHVLGGDITLHNDSGYNYTLTLMIYRDTVEFILPPNILLDIYTFDSGIAEYTYDSTMIIAMDSPLTNTMAPISPYRTQSGYYTRSLVLPPANYQFVYISCCRNPLILNAQQVALANSVFHTEFQVFSNSKNSSPHTILNPTYNLPINAQALINPLPCDDDADSVSMSLLTPLATYSSSVTSVFGTVTGFTQPPAAPSGDFSINPVSGEITYIPNAQGNYIQSFQIKEYRNGLEIGSVMEDMEFIVGAVTGTDSLSFSAITPVSHTTYQNYNYLLYTPGQALNFQIAGSISNVASNVRMNVYGSIFNMPNPATFTTTGSANNLSGTLSWTPPVGFSNTIIVVFRLTSADSTIIKDYTLLLRSTPPTNSVTQTHANINQLKVYPNPVHDNLHLSLRVPQTINSNISMINMLGQEVENIFSGNLPEGTYNFNKDIKLPAGVYYIVVKGNGTVMDTRCVIVE